jgi:hypothetical protein
MPGAKVLTLHCLRVRITKQKVKITKILCSMDDRTTGVISSKNKFGEERVEVWLKCNGVSIVPTYCAVHN